MPLQIYNTLSNRIEPFEPQVAGDVTMYVCGITPYDTTHLGHAFTYISFDILYRFLASTGNQVKYVQNVTDIDDDLLKKAVSEGEDWKKFGNEWTKRFLEDMRSLNWVVPDPYVKATDSISKMVQIISDLETKGLAYNAGGTVYFETSKYPQYGKLSQFSRDEMIKLSAERGADPKDPNKKDPLDFILWQKKKDDEPAWNSPWGEGRPGWHIECSAMVNSYLGNQIDIHGGGDDLIYPHHESEIAQSENFTSLVPFSKFWMHTGSVHFQGQKMSKSLGNLVMVSDLLKKYSSNALRFLLLSHHWKSSWEYQEEELAQATAKMAELENDLKANGSEGALDAEFIAALENNLNTPQALQILLTKKPQGLRSHLQLLGFMV